MIIFQIFRPYRPRPTGIAAKASADQYSIELLVGWSKLFSWIMSKIVLQVLVRKKSIISFIPLPIIEATTFLLNYKFRVLIAH